MKSATDLVAGAKSADRSLTAEEMVSAKGFIDEIKAIDLELKAGQESDSLAAQLAGFGNASPEQGNGGGGGYKPKSIGDNFVHNLKTKGLSLKTPGTIAVNELLLTKAATDTQMVGGNEGAYGPLITDIDKDFVFPKRQRPVIADLMGSGTLSGTAITYPVFGALEGGTGMVAEGGQKPQLHLADPTWQTDALSEVAGWFKITDDMAEDLAYIVSEINSTALYDLAMKEEAQLLNGTGTSPQLKGLLNRSGVQDYAPLAGSITVADALFHAMGLVETATNFTADGLVINPVDYEKLRLGKDGNGQYHGGGYFQGQYGNGGIVVNPPVWGRNTIVTTATPVGEALTGAFSTAKVFRKGGVRVESTNSHEDDFTNDKITIRVRERLALQVKYPSAFVKVTLPADE